MWTGEFDGKNEGQEKGPEGCLLYISQETTGFSIVTRTLWTRYRGLGFCAV